MRILVTGGCGFIGSCFVRHMLRAHPNYEIVNLDALTYAATPESLAEVENAPNYTFIHGDITRQEDVEKAMRGCDAVVHFAAETHVDNSNADSLVFTHTNVFGTHLLLMQALKQGIKRFVHISTDEVYGPIREGSFREEDVLRPTNPYSASKAGAEHMVMAFFTTHKLPVVITRSSNNFGPFQNPEKVIPLFVSNLSEGKKVPLYGKGMNIREWIFVEDNCTAIDLVLHRGVLGEVYNISSNYEMTNLELTKQILRLMGKDESSIAFVQDRPGHDLRYSVDTEKIRALGWKPAHSFDGALKVTIDWYRANHQWVDAHKKRRTDDYFERHTPK